MATRKNCVGFNQIYLGKPGEKCAQKQSGKTKKIKKKTRDNAQIRLNCKVDRDIFNKRGTTT